MYLYTKKPKTSQPKNNRKKPKNPTTKNQPNTKNHPNPSQNNSVTHSVESKTVICLQGQKLLCAACS